MSDDNAADDADEDTKDPFTFQRARTDKSMFRAMARKWKAKYTLDDTQLEALCNIVIKQQNQLIVGGGGFGKSHVANAAIDIISATRTVGCVAPSRLAAGNFKGRGRTIAAMLGLRKVHWPSDKEVTPDQFMLFGPSTLRDDWGDYPFVFHKRHELLKEQKEWARTGVVRDDMGNEAEIEFEPDGNDDNSTSTELWLPILSNKVAHQVRALDVLFVDECFFLNEFRFTQMIEILNFYRQTPDGGTLPLQLVFIGDHCQTRPICVKPGGPIKSYLGMHSFELPAFKRLFPLDTNAVEFSTNHRVADEWYAGFLRRLRAPSEGEKFTQEDIDNIKQRCASYTPGESHLAVKHNAVADAAYAIVSHKDSSNRHSDYASLATWRHHVDEHHPMPDKRLFTGKESNGGPPPPHEIMPRKMELFVGCPVKAYVVEGDYTISTNQFCETTHRKTVTMGHYYANRREVRGIVTELSTHGIYVRCSEKEPLYIEPISVQKMSMQNGRPIVVAQWNGLPAWAEPAGTVHSVQGQTKHDQHHVFIDGAWEIAMIYVALSRTRHPSLVHLIGSIERLNNRFYSKSDDEKAPKGTVLVDQRVLAFQESITNARGKKRKVTIPPDINVLTSRSNGTVVEAVLDVEGRDDKLSTAGFEWCKKRAAMLRLTTCADTSVRDLLSVGALSVDLMHPTTCTLSLRRSVSLDDWHRVNDAFRDEGFEYDLDGGWAREMSQREAYETFGDAFNTNSAEAAERCKRLRPTF